MQKKIEKNVMNIGAFSNVILFGTGLYIYLKEKMVLRLLMCAMSLITFITYAIGGKISQASSKKTDRFPDGRYYLEPLYSILKSLFFLALMAVSLVQTGENAKTYFLTGTGTVMNIRALMIFNIVNLAVGLAVYLIAEIQNRKMGNISTILKNVSATNFLAVVQSLFMIILLEGIKYLNAAGKLVFLSYTGEFFIVVIMCAMSVKVQNDVIARAFTELRHGVTDTKDIHDKISLVLSQYPELNGFTYKAIKTGMMIFVNISLPQNADSLDFEAAKNAKDLILKGLEKYYSNVCVNFQF